MGFWWSSNKKKEEDKKTKAEQAKPQEKGTVGPTAEKLDPEAEKDKLVRIAATFLANPNIEKESFELKTAFLRKKGLSDDMIKKAFDLYKDKIRMMQEEKELKEELESIKSGGKSKQSEISVT